MTTKIPQHGDPELLPKPVIEYPSNRRLPFGPSGVLLPNGPEFNVSRVAPDLRGLAWQRLANDEWTSPEQRDVVLKFLIGFFRRHPEFVKWKIIERDRTDRLTIVRLLDPILKFVFIRKADRKEFEVAMQFPKIDRDSLARFEAKVKSVEAIILTLHAASPATESSCG